MSGNKPAEFPLLTRADPVKELMLDQRIDVFVETLYAMCPDLLAVNIQLVRTSEPPTKTHVEIMNAQAFGPAIAFDCLQIALHNACKASTWRCRSTPEPRARGGRHGH